MSENIRTENWCGYDIRFVEYEDNWYAVLKDICDALKLRTDSVRLRIESEHLVKLGVECVDKMPINYEKVEPILSGVNFSEYNHTHHMLCVDEAGIYQALSRSTRLEARKFIDWISHSLVDLRKAIGLESYEALKMTDASVQKLIADKIDISYVEPTGDIVPVKAEPTIINNYVGNVNYRKVFGYAAAGCVCAVVVYCGIKYIVKRVKAKKVVTKED